MMNSHFINGTSIKSFSSCCFQFTERTAREQGWVNIFGRGWEEIEFQSLDGIGQITLAELKERKKKSWDMLKQTFWGVHL